MANHDFIPAIRNAELRQAIRSILLEMAMLGEAPARSLEPSVSGSKAEDRAPRGTWGRREDLSLHEFFATAFAQAVPAEEKLRKLLYRAERELRWHKKGIDTDRLTLQRERDEARDIEVLLQFGERKPAAVIAELYSWPIGWVRMVRERNGKDPEMGLERPKWRETPEEERYAICGRLCDEGLNQTEAAARLGIAKSTVNPYWPRRLRSVA